jgi:hypothetical protein
MSESILKRLTRLLILAEAARAVGDLEDYCKIKTAAAALRIQTS